MRDCWGLPPRAVYPDLPMDHPLGFPGQTFRQLQILRFLLKYTQEINTPGTLIELDLSGKDDPKVKCEVCGFE
jgi:hypothetical protein